MLYQWDATGEVLERIANGFWKVRTTTDETRARAEALVRGTLLRAEEIDAAIVAVARNWRLDRMAAVDRSILRLGVYELLAEPQTPPAVVINEAVEMAKRFGEADSAAFVNGILDGVFKQRGARVQAVAASRAGDKQ
jgi:transcription antitermination protein NusB